MARYTDFDLNMTRHPLTGDVALIEDVVAIKRSVKNIVLTNYKERPFNIPFGANIRNQLFEPAEPFTAMTIRKAIIFAIEKFEPRVRILEVTVSDDVDRNEFKISIYFSIRHLNKDVGMDIQLSRVR